MPLNSLLFVNRRLILAGLGLWLILTLITLGGCSRDDAQVQISVCSDMSVPGELDAIRVTVLDEARVQQRTGILELLECPAERVKTLPQAVHFDPVAGDVWIVVSGFLDGIERVRFERRADMANAPDGEITTILRRACLGFSCPLGQTCVNGRCDQVPREVSSGLCAPGAPPQQADVGREPADVAVPDDQTPVPRPVYYCPQPDVGLDAADSEESL
ncbi:MAG: hypothetical protein H0U74_23560 [Bradymonadaceae bacterium]|nr:hypothetical protein [Lujinxingiaceae bacterium]